MLMFRAPLKGRPGYEIQSLSLDDARRKAGFMESGSLDQSHIIRQQREQSRQLPWDTRYHRRFQLLRPGQGT